MATKQYTLPIKHIEKTTAECSLVTFDVDETLADVFAYKQGQYLTLETDIHGEKVRRSYSLCSSPLDHIWQVAVKKVPNGKFSTFVNESLHVGDTLQVMPPDGRFYVETAPEQAKNYVAFAAGSGITPILSIIKTHLHVEPQSTFTLFYVNQAVSTIILKEALEALKNRYLERFKLFHFLTREARDVPLFNGRIDAEKLDTIFEKIIDKSDISDYFVCGPDQMIFLVRDYLYDMGVDKKQVHFELFNTGNIAPKKRKSLPVHSDKMTEVIIQEGGKSFTYKLPTGSNNILDAALENHADLPFACKGGVCCTCRAKLLEGEVEMDVHYGLEPEEIEAGYILTCQAVPTTERVVVDFEG